MAGINTTRPYLSGRYLQKSAPTQLGCRDTVSIRKYESMMTAYAFRESIREGLSLSNPRRLYPEGTMLPLLFDRFRKRCYSLWTGLGKKAIVGPYLAAVTCGTSRSLMLSMVDPKNHERINLFIPIADFCIVTGDSQSTGK